ncbi:MAG: heme lyase CcmF/NrfE family subunit [Gammaproteobacteria bacterium]|nr:heme lyase CcmF/NrfE family subunit [Gammaproteobacteria bacterium]
MVPEFGLFSLIAAFCLSLVLGTLPLIGAYKNDLLWMNMARPLAAGIFVFLFISLAVLAHGFFTDDFSIRFVAQHSNSLLPVRYKLTAIWGGHEGSFLLWTCMLSAWTLAVGVFSKNIPLDFLARVMGLLGLLLSAYILFMLATSNPFDRLVPMAPINGSDLNPALQDFGFIVHPPALYMGYVGFSVVFAFAVAALLSGRLDAAWARWCRPWANVSWAILTIGIALGSWWAYYELGWGGWWAWDPVENPPLITWLFGTALIHSLAVTEKRGVFKSWTILLAIFAFSGSLLGTFITRSGLLTSVHAFASDPSRGIFILGILGSVIGCSLLLFALRAHRLKSDVGFGMLSRETMLLANNAILVVAGASVLLGTLFPMVYQALTGGLISIGPPYFNTIFAPLMVLLVILLGVGPFCRWKKTSAQYLLRQLMQVAVASIILGIGLPLLIVMEFSLAATIAVTLAAWIVLSIGRDLLNKTANKPTRMKGLRSLSMSYYGMQTAHIGIAVMLVGVVITSTFSSEKSVLLLPGQATQLGKYNFTFNGTKPVEGPNFVADEASLTVDSNGKTLTTLHPQRRLYTASGSRSTEMAIDASLFRDLFITLGDPGRGGSWSMTIYIKPFIRWIWFGAILIAGGGCMSAADKRYRRRRVRSKAIDKNSLAGELSPVI